MIYNSDKPTLCISWGKAYGEIYCHHASLFIPYHSISLFLPDIIRVGVTIRANNVDKGEIIGYIDNDIVRYLPCSTVDGGIYLPLNSASIIKGLSLNMWTKFKNGERGTLKEYPIRLIYQVGDEEMKELAFNHIALQTPYLMGEPLFANLKDGEKVDTVINFD